MFFCPRRSLKTAILAGAFARRLCFSALLARKFGNSGAAAEFGPSSGGYLIYGAYQSAAARGLIPFSPSSLLQVLLHEEGSDSGFVSLSRLGPSLRDKDLEMEELMLQDETLLGTMQSYMDASLISLIEDFGSLGEVSWGWAWISSSRSFTWEALAKILGMALLSQDFSFFLGAQPEPFKCIFCL